MDFSHLSFVTVSVLGLVLFAEFTNGCSDAPVGTSAAVASGALTSRRALQVTAIGNFLGLIVALVFGASVAATIGKGIVQPGIISVSSIGVAMLTTIVWASVALWRGLPVSKTHSLLAALAGIGFAQGGLQALLPIDGVWQHSGWVKVGEGVFLALVCGALFSYFLTRIVRALDLNTKISLLWWKRLQLCTVWAVSSGHGFNDGLKYVGIFTLVLFISGVIPEFHVFPEVIVLCAIVMGLGTLVGGWRIHHRLDKMVNKHQFNAEEKTYLPYMGVSTEVVAASFIWSSGLAGIPMSTNHGVVASMVGSKLAAGVVDTSTLLKVIQGWILTYIFCAGIAYSVSIILF